MMMLGSRSEVCGFAQEALEELRQWRASDEWPGLVTGAFVPKHIVTPTGARWRLEATESVNEKQFQISLNLPSETTIGRDDVESWWHAGMQLSGNDLLRIHEFDAVIEDLNMSIEMGEIENPQGSGGLINLSSFCDIGFAFPRLLKYYGEAGFDHVKGYDINNIAVAMAIEAGWQASTCDLNDVNNIGVDLTGVDVVSCYRVLERVKNPVAALRGLYNAASPGTFFHIETALDFDRPKQHLGHVIGMHRLDLPRWAQLVGFGVINHTHQSLRGELEIARIVCLKP